MKSNPRTGWHREARSSRARKSRAFPWWTLWEACVEWLRCARYVQRCGSRTIAHTPQTKGRSMRGANNWESCSSQRRSPWRWSSVSGPCTRWRRKLTILNAVVALLVTYRSREPAESQLSWRGLGRADCRPWNLNKWKRVNLNLNLVIERI